MTDMADVLTPEQRSKCMSHIRGKGTSIETALQKALWHKGFRYRKNYKKLPGHPDIVLIKYRLCVFCDSDYFHGKDWDTYLHPLLLKSNNSAFWIAKIERNMERDRQIDKALEEMGWKVLHFWGSDIKKHLDDCVAEIETVIDQIKPTK